MQDGERCFCNGVSAMKHTPLDSDCVRFQGLHGGDYEECRLLGYKNSSYLTGDILRLRYRAQPVNAM
jgi:hypothetical protein